MNKAIRMPADIAGPCSGIRWKAIVAAAALGLVLSPVAAPADSHRDAGQVMGVVKAFIDGLNSGDTAAVEALHEPSAVIVDSIPPFSWSGPGAYGALMKDYEQLATQSGITDTRVALRKGARVEVNANRAYVSVAADVYAVEAGVPTQEPGRFVFAFDRVKGAWKIAGWSWAGEAIRRGKAIGPAKSAAK